MRRMILSFAYRVDNSPASASKYTYYTSKGPVTQKPL